MAVFAIIAPAPEPRLDAAVKAAFPDNHFVIAPGQYLVADSKALTPDISQRIGAPSGNVGLVLVIPVSNYAGWHNKDLWEWIVSRSNGAVPPSALSAKNG
jgi:hypothetical protein